jgi:hypothetical protein
VFGAEHQLAISEPHQHNHLFTSVWTKRLRTARLAYRTSVQCTDAMYQFDTSMPVFTRVNTHTATILLPWRSLNGALTSS